jgi:hypothetical protein
MTSQERRRNRNESRKNGTGPSWTRVMLLQAEEVVPPLEGCRGFRSGGAESLRGGVLREQDTSVGSVRTTGCSVVKGR